MDPASLKVRTQKKLLGRCSHYQRKVLLINRGQQGCKKSTKPGKLQGLEKTRFSLWRGVKSPDTRTQFRPSRAFGYILCKISRRPRLGPLVWAELQTSLTTPSSAGLLSSCCKRISRPGSARSLVSLEETYFLLGCLWPFDSTSC